jgi:hypothetical protein
MTGKTNDYRYELDNGTQLSGQDVDIIMKALGQYSDDEHAELGAEAGELLEKLETEGFAQHSNPPAMISLGEAT